MPQSRIAVEASGAGVDAMTRGAGVRVMSVLLVLAGTATAAAAAVLPRIAPQPPPRPDRAPAAIEPARPAAPPKPSQEPRSRADAECLAALDRLGVRYEALPPLSDGACGTPNPLRVTHLADGVALSAPSTMTCGTADALARWVLDVVGPEAEQSLGKPVSAVLIGTSYECRGQNRREGAKLSEHAFAAAVDVMGFALGQQKTVAVGPVPPETPEGRFHAAARTGACRYFNTVLGPGSDPEHATHLHLDLRGRKGGYRICQ